MSDGSGRSPVTGRRSRRPQLGGTRSGIRFGPGGVVKGARFVASPNCNDRPAGCAVDLLVIHYISLPPGVFGGPAIIEFFTNRLDSTAHPFYAGIAELKASSHFLIRRDGELIQFVPCDRRAWHAGESSWKGRARCNDFSIGIEVEGTGDVPYTEPQYARLAALTRALQARYPITDIVGHSDIAPGRKQDPGPHFDWARYRAMLKREAGTQRTHRTPSKNRVRTSAGAGRAQRTGARARSKTRRRKRAR